MALHGAALGSYLSKQLPLDLRRDTAEAALKSQLKMEEEVKRGHSGRVRRVGLFYESAPGNVVATRTGTAVTSINGATFQRGDMVFAVVGTPVRYMLAQELGARIRPKRGRSLIVPTVYACTPTGRLKDKWAHIMAQGGLRSMGKAGWKAERLFVMRKKGKSEGGWIAQRTGDSLPVRGRGGRMRSTQRPTLLFKLVSEVNIAARHVYGKALERVQPYVTGQFNGALGLALRRVRA